MVDQERNNLYKYDRVGPDIAVNWFDFKFTPSILFVGHSIGPELRKTKSCRRFYAYDRRNFAGVGRQNKGGQQHGCTMFADLSGYEYGMKPKLTQKEKRWKGVGGFVMSSRSRISESSLRCLLLSKERGQGCL